jgi:hypothetical protein
MGVVGRGYYNAISRDLYDLIPYWIHEVYKYNLFQFGRHLVAADSGQYVFGTYKRTISDSLSWR